VPPPSAAGTTQGNPAPDSAGNLVWHYDYIQGGDGLGAPNQWFEGPLIPLVWDDTWYGGTPGWAVSDDFGPVVKELTSTHQFQQPPGGWHAYAPVLRWRNVTNQSFAIDISGSLRLGWSGDFNQTFPADIDVVVAHRSGATGALTTLLTRTVAKPTQNNVNESTELDVALPNVAIAPGDDLLLTHRARSTSLSSCWVNLTDRLCLVRVPIGASYCGPGNPNSSGGPSRMDAHGSTRIADNDLTLRAYRLPVNSFAWNGRLGGSWS
jgi:hypothetical protein